MSDVTKSGPDPSHFRDDALANTSRIAGLAGLLKETRGDASVCIAILDGPVDLSHACFAGADLKTVGGLPGGVRASGGALLHGTHVASVVFGQPGTCVEGIASGCRGLVVPVFADGPNGTVAPCSEIDLARAITRAVEGGADIINISGGRLAHTGEASQFLADAVKQGAEQGVLVVAAGGNDGCDCLHVPAALPNVIAVGAMDTNGRPLQTSNWGERYLEQGILALGEGIRGAAPDGGIAALTGTSFAAPIVSGVAGLLLSLQHLRGESPDLDRVREAILTTATVCDPQASDDCRRHLVGALNVSAAHNAIAHGVGRGPPESTAASTNEETVASVFDLGRRNSMTSTGEAPVSIQPSSATPEPASSPSTPPPEAGEAGVIASGIAEAGETSPAATSDVAMSVRPSEAPAAAEQPPATARDARSGAIAPSACCEECAAAEQKQLVYVLGHLGYDFGTEPRLDSLQLAMGAGKNAFVAEDLLALLEEHPQSATAVIWTLNLDLTPIYAIQPSGTFGAETYAYLRNVLKEQLPAKGKKEIDISERVSVAGVISGEVRLLNGMTIPVITPEFRGMFNWSTKALIEELKAMRPEEGDKKYDPFDGLENFLRRIYEECRNLGVSPQDRAKNYAATNAYNLQNIFAAARSREMHMEAFTVTKSPICRPDSDCWDIHFKFYFPDDLLNRAHHVWIMTVDVSDVVPVVVGAPRHWTTI